MCLNIKSAFSLNKKNTISWKNYDCKQFRSLEKWDCLQETIWKELVISATSYCLSISLLHDVISMHHARRRCDSLLEMFGASEIALSSVIILKRGKMSASVSPSFFRYFSVWFYSKRVHWFFKRILSWCDF